METTELQNNIIRKILSTDNIQLLTYLNKILTLDTNQKPNELSDFEKNFINESISDYQKGNTNSNEDVFLKNEKWLEK